MNTNTLAVLALDAADYRLVQEFDCTNLLLDNHDHLETHAYGHRYPYTFEVWPVVATGVPPQDSGITRESMPEWDSRVLQLASKFAGHLPNRLRSKIGGLLHSAGAGRHRGDPVTDHSHVFDAVDGWPGVTPAPHVHEAIDLYMQLLDGELRRSELDPMLSRDLSHTIDWLSSVTGLVGSHTHILDAAGHVFCEAGGQDQLREYYRIADARVGDLRDRVDDLLIVSDHGMQVQDLGDPEPGEHSYRAMVATTIDGALPRDIEDVANWLDERRPIVDDPQVSDAVAARLDRLYRIDPESHS